MADGLSDVDKVHVLTMRVESLKQLLLAAAERERGLCLAVVEYFEALSAYEHAEANGHARVQDSVRLARARTTLKQLSGRPPLASASGDTEAVAAVLYAAHAELQEVEALDHWLTLGDPERKRWRDLAYRVLLGVPRLRGLAGGQ